MTVTLILTRKVGADDIEWGEGTFSYVDPITGITTSMPRVNSSHIAYTSQPDKTLDSLIDGSNSLIIKPLDAVVAGYISAGGALTVAGSVTFPVLTPAGYVKNSVAGLLSTGSIAAADLPTAIDAAKIADGSVSNTEFQYLANVTSDIQSQINGISVSASPYALLQNRQAASTSGGTASSGSWLIVPLNTEVEDADDIVDSAALPAFTLVAGTYEIEAISPFFRVGSFSTRLYNVTDVAVVLNVGATAMYGSRGAANEFDSTENVSIVLGTFTLTGTKQLRLEYQVQSTAAIYGHGLASSFGPEVYAQVKIVKRA